MADPLVTHIFARKDLHMSAGKLAAQCVHAAAGVCTQSHEPVIVLAGKNEHHLIMLAKWADGRHPYFVVTDAGRTEVAPGTVTCLAVRAPAGTFKGTEELY